MKTDRPAAAPRSCLELLAELVAHDTVNPLFGGRPGGEAALIARLEHWAGEWSLVARRLPVPGENENLLLTAPEVPGAPWLMFESHLDTVGVAGMTVPA